MMCYRDRTWCNYWRTCITGRQCDRALTSKVLKRAQEWMANPPIATYAEHPQCYRDWIGEILNSEDEDISEILGLAGAEVLDDIDY